MRTIAGTFTYHLELEEALARFKGTESALVLQSGFTANQGVLGASSRRATWSFPTS